MRPGFEAHSCTGTFTTRGGPCRPAIHHLKSPAAATAASMANAPESECHVNTDTTGSSRTPSRPGENGRGGTRPGSSNGMNLSSLGTPSGGFPAFFCGEIENTTLRHERQRSNSCATPLLPSKSPLRHFEHQLVGSAATSAVGPAGTLEKLSFAFLVRHHPGTPSRDGIERLQAPS